MKKLKIGWAKKHFSTCKHGYTIIEVMIFLAVSGMMFVLAAVFINGKQDEVAFRQGINAAGSAVTNAINTVANGEFPSKDNLSCSASGSGVPSITSASKGQGTNGGKDDTSSGCIFLGKVLSFGFGSDKTEYKSYTVAARQYAPTSGPIDCFETEANEPVQNLCEAKPIVVASPVSLTQTDTLEHGLTFIKAYRCKGDCTGAGADNSKNDISGVGMFGSFVNYNGGDSISQSSGAQHVTVATLSSFPTDGSNIYSYVNNLSTDDSYVVLCFARGDKYGQVMIGGSHGQQTSVSVDFNKGEPCQS